MNRLAAAAALCLAAACGSGKATSSTGGRGGNIGAGGRAGQGAAGTGGQGGAGVAGQGTGGGAGQGTGGGAGSGTGTGGTAGQGGASAGASGNGGSTGSGGSTGGAPVNPLDLPCAVEGWGSPLIAAFSNDGSLYAVGTDAGIVKIIRTVDDQPIVSVAAHDTAIVALRIAADNSRFATAGADNTIAVWNMSGVRIAKIPALTKLIWALALSPDGTRLAEVGSEDSVVGRVYSIPQGTQVARFSWSNVQRFSRAVTFSPDGSKVITYGMEVVTWNAATGEMVGSVALQDTPGGAWIDVTPDGNTVLEGEPTRANVFDARDGHRTAQIFWSSSIRMVALSRDGRSVAVKAQTPNTAVFDVAAPDWPKYSIPEGINTTLAMGATGEDLLYQGDSTWHSITHRRLSAGTRSDIKSPTESGVVSLRLSPDGQRRLVVDSYGFVYVTSVPDGATIATFSRSIGDYKNAWFWPPQPQLAITGTNYVDVAPLPTGTVQTLPASVVDGQLAAMSDDGNVLAYDAAGMVVVRDRAGIVKRTIAHTGTARVALSPTGDRLAMGLSDGSLQIFALDGGADVPPIASAHLKGVKVVAFTPDGNTVVSAGGDGQGIFWRASDLSGLRSVMVSLVTEFSPTTTGEPRSVAFSPDGSLVAFGIMVMADFQARLFRVADGSLVTSFHGFGPSGAVNGIAFSPDGHRLILGGSDTTIRTYCLP